MFVQTMQGKVTNFTAVRAEWLRQEQALDRCSGYLGATAGVTDDGSLIAMVRWATAAAARPVSVAGLADVRVTDSWRTDVWNRGGSDGATFVQIRQGTSNDPERLRDLYVNQQPVRMGPHRPEVLGGLFAWDDYGGFTLSAYFTSERAARAGENLVEFEPFFADIDAVMQNVTYFDLRDPWLLTGREDLAVKDDEERAVARRPVAPRSRDRRELVGRR